MQRTTKFAGAGVRALGLLLSATTTLVLAVGLAGCGSDNNSLTNPVFQPEIANAPDNFQLQATNVTDVSQIVEYTWQNSGTAANVDQSCAITQGNATLQIYDSSNALVYTKDLTQGGSDVSGTGTTGAWKIRVTLMQVDGTVNFRVQKNT